MTEIRLSVDENHHRHALRTEEWERTHVDVCRDENAKDERHAHPGDEPAQPAAGDAHTVPLGVVQAHRPESRCMNCAMGEASLRSSTKRIADFERSIRAAGSCSS